MGLQQFHVPLQTPIRGFREGAKMSLIKKSSSSLVWRARLPFSLSKALLPYALATPAFLVLGVVLIYPLAQNIYLSFFKWRYTDLANIKFVGLDNYTQLLTQDPLFWQVLRFTLIFTALTIIIEFAIGLGSALLLVSISRLRTLFTSILIMPYMVAAIAAGLLWRLLWTGDIGLVNYFLSLVGIHGPTWLVDSHVVLFTVVIPEVWRSTPFVTLIVLAGLVSQPQDVLEAAKVDGASRLQEFLYVTLPLLIPSIAVALLFQTVFKLRVFDLVYILTGGGPGTETMPLGILIYNASFRYLDGGYAATIASPLLLLGLAISIFYIKVIYRTADF